MSAINSDELEVIQRLILNPILDRLDKMEKTLEEIGKLYEGQHALDMLVQQMKSSQSVCSAECKGRIGNMENWKKLQEERPEKTRVAWQSWIGIIGGMIGILATLKAFGALK